MHQPIDPARPHAVAEGCARATRHRRGRRVLMRWFLAPMTVCALLGLSACSSPTPSTPGEAANDIAEPAGGEDAAGEAPVRGMPTMIPPGGGEEYFSITVEPTEDVGYPPPPTKTFEERQQEAYPAPGDATIDEGADVQDGGADEATEGDAGEDVSSEDTSDVDDAGEAGDADEGDEG